MGKRLWSETLWSETLWSETKGAVSTEYIVIVGTIALGFAVALASLAPTLLSDYFRTQAMVGHPKFPE